MGTGASVVVGVDGSVESLAAVSWAARDAALRGAGLLIVTAMYDGLPGGTPSRFLGNQEIERRSGLDQAAERARDAAGGRPLSIETRIVTGPPGAVLLEMSVTERMVVVGARGRGEFDGSLLGSVSAALVAYAQCPVTVIGSEPREAMEDEPAPVVVGVDGSVYTSPVVGAAFEEAAMRGAELVAVHAACDLDLSNLVDAAGRDAEVWWRSRIADEETVLAERLAEATASCPDVPVFKVVVRDRPAWNLGQCAETAQLLVVGDRGRGGFAGMLLGSTSQTLLGSVRCPLMIVRGRAVHGSGADHRTVVPPAGAGSAVIVPPTSAARAARLSSP